MEWLLEARGMTKSFSGVPVLKEVTFELRPGEVHAVVGENGAGKSTLMKLLAGLERPDTGELWVKGRKTTFRSPHDALRCGVAMIQQEPLPFLNLSVAENVFMGQAPASRVFGWVDKGSLHHQTALLLEQLAIPLSPMQSMTTLRVAEMQAVEIAKALAHRADVLIMDEPTSALSEREAEALFATVRDLRRRGVSLIYISHKLGEVFRLADRVTVLRDGAQVGTYAIGELTTERLITLMVGRELRELFPKANAQPGDHLLSVQGLAKAGRFTDVTFTVRAGETVGIGGLMGAGRTDVVNAIYGLAPADSGEIRVRGRIVKITRPRDALRAGIGLVSEDRKMFGFVPTMGVKGNMTLASLKRWCRGGLIDRRSEARIVDEQIRRLGIKSSHRDQLVSRLSGGNQQKTVLARTLLTGPDILLLDEPTRGIDIRAKAEVHQLISELVRAGKGVVLVSSELPELLALSDRLLVMRQGRITAELDARQTSPEEVLRFAIPE
jgi:inositol transport system ATP-binding protein